MGDPVLTAGAPNRRVGSLNVFSLFITVNLAVLRVEKASAPNRGVGTSLPDPEQSLGETTTGKFRVSSTVATHRSSRTLEQPLLLVFSPPRTLGVGLAI